MSLAPSHHRHFALQSYYGEASVQQKVLGLLVGSACVRVCVFSSSECLNAKCQLYCRRFLILLKLNQLRLEFFHNLFLTAISRIQILQYLAHPYELPSKVYPPTYSPSAVANLMPLCVI